MGHGNGGSLPVVGFHGKRIGPATSLGSVQSQGLTASGVYMYVRSRTEMYILLRKIHVVLCDITCTGFRLAKPCLLVATYYPASRCIDHTSARRKFVQY